MAENSNSPPNNKETLNNLDLSVETSSTELEISLSELKIEPSGRPHFTNESLREFGLSLDPESEVSNFFDDQANIENNIFNQENDDMGSDELDFGVGLGFSDDDDYNINSWLIDEYDDMSSNIYVSYMGGMGGNEVFAEGENVNSDASELVTGNVSGDVTEINEDSPWIGAGDWDVNDVGHLDFEEIDRLSRLAGLVFDDEGDDVHEEMSGEDGSIIGVREGEGWGSEERNIHGWVVNVGRTQDEVDDGYFNQGDYFIGMILEQLLLESVPENPASRSVVENLASVVFTQENIENDCMMCAVCKEDFNVGAIAKKLPCSHHYHENCILPWLEMQNTCPICRYKLPTDDPE